MAAELLLAAIILMLCIIANKFSGRFGMPALILFIGIGMLFGSDGIVKIPFDNFQVTESICTIALGFIMFYGGFNTKWKAAKPVAVKSLLEIESGSNDPTAYMLTVVGISLVNGQNLSSIPYAIFA